MRVTDVTGDGKADVVGRYVDGSWWVGVANAASNGFDSEYWGAWPTNVLWADVQAAEVTGADGALSARKFDMVGRANSGAWCVAVSNGEGFDSQYWGSWTPGITYAWSVSKDGNLLVSGSGSALSFTPDVAGTYVATLTAADKDALGVPVQQTIVVSAGLAAFAAPPTPAAAADLLTLAQLAPVVELAISQWQAAGLDAPRLAALRQVHLAIVDLPGLQLGRATRDTITLDVNAAGYDWSHDWSVASASSGCDEVASRMDLLTAVLHELGHVAGLEDQYGELDSADVMSGWLLPGTHRSPTLADVDAAFANSDWRED